MTGHQPPVVASFDIFDTLLTRRIGHPHTMFAMLGRRLHQAGTLACESESFAAARLAAEDAARESAAAEDILLDAVLAELAVLLRLDPPAVAAIRAAELALEAELLVPLPGAAERLAAARTRCQRLVFCSEMYLPPEFIQAQLEAHGFWQEGDRLYLSGTEGCSKHTGKLFERLMEREGLEPRQLLHHGDHPEADLAVHHALGIRVHPLPAGRLNRYEQILSRHATATGGISSALAGASRLARLEAAAEDDPVTVAARDLAAGAAAPMLIAFTMWVLRQAAADGRRRLYFAARDGWLPYRLAERLAPALGLDLDCRYLLVSRQALLPAAVTEVDQSTLRWLLRPADELTLRRVLARLEETPEALAEPLAASGLTAADWDRPVTDDWRRTLAEALTRDPLRQVILDVAASRRDLALGYLAQEGLTDDEPHAIVDVGWKGSLQDALGRLLGHARLAGYYFGLDQRDPSADPSPRQAWFYDSGRRQGAYHLVPGINQFLEMLAGADHGQTIGYRRVGQHIEPVQRPVNETREWQRTRLMRQVVLSVGDRLLLAPDLLDLTTSLRDAVAAALAELKLRPTVAEAQALGALPVSDDQTGLHAHPLAQPFRLTQLPAVLRTGRMPEPTVNNWYHGSLVLTAPPTAFALRVAARIGRMLNARL